MEILRAGGNPNIEGALSAEKRKCTTADDDLCEIISNISEDGNFNDEDAMLKKIEPFIGLSTQESMAALNKCGFISSSSLVQKLLFRTQSNWRAALTVFQWAASQEN